MTRYGCPVCGSTPESSTCVMCCDGDMPACSLALKPREDVGVSGLALDLLAENHLHRDAPSGAEVARLVNGAHTAFSEKADDLVPLIDYVAGRHAPFASLLNGLLLRQRDSKVGWLTPPLFTSRAATPAKPEAEDRSKHAESDRRGRQILRLRRTRHPQPLGLPARCRRRPYRARPSHCGRLSYCRCPSLQCRRCYRCCCCPHRRCCCRSIRHC